MDIEILLFLQRMREALGAGWTSFFQKLTFFGEVSTVMVIMAAVYWCVSRELGTYLLTGWHWNRIVNGFLKVTVCAYRPWIRDARIVSDAKALETATGYSFPSGHSTNGATIFAGLGVDKRNGRALRCVGWLIAILIAFSRIYLGVHTPQDVLVGLLGSALVMYLTTFAIRYIEAHKNGDVLPAVLSVLAAVAVAVYASVKSYPVDYDANGKLLVDGAKMARDTFTGVGLNVGFFTGLLIERRWVRFSSEGTMQARILRLLAGLPGFYLINLVLGTAIKGWLPGGAGLVAANALTSFYIVCGYPWLVRLVQRRA